MSCLLRPNSVKQWRPWTVRQFWNALMGTDTKDDNIVRVTRCPGLGLGLTSGWEWNAWNAENVRIPMDASRLRKTKILVPLTILLLVIGCHYFNALPLTVFKLFPRFYTHKKEELWHEIATRSFVFEVTRVPARFCVTRDFQMLHSNGADIDEIWSTMRWNIFIICFFFPSPSRKEKGFPMSPLTVGQHVLCWWINK